MFYKNAKPLKVYRSRIPLPYRTEDEVARSAEVYFKLYNHTLPGAGW